MGDERIGREITGMLNAGIDPTGMQPTNPGCTIDCGCGGATVSNEKPKTNWRAAHCKWCAAGEPQCNVGGMPGNKYFHALPDRAVISTPCTAPSPEDYIAQLEARLEKMEGVLICANNNTKRRGDALAVATEKARQSEVDCNIARWDAQTTHADHARAVGDLGKVTAERDQLRELHREALDALGVVRGERDKLKVELEEEEESNGEFLGVLDKILDCPDDQPMSLRLLLEVTAKQRMVELDQLRDGLAVATKALEEIDQMGTRETWHDGAEAYCHTPECKISRVALSAPAILAERERRVKLEAEHARMRAMLAGMAMDDFASPREYREAAERTLANLGGTAAQEPKP